MYRRILSIARAVFLDSIKRRVLLVVLLFAGIMTALIPLLPSYGVGVVRAVFGEFAITLTYITALVVTIALAVTRIPGQIDRPTVYSILARPVARFEYVVGTWLGTFVTAGVLIAAFTVVSETVGLATYGDPLITLWVGALGIWLEIGVLAAFAIAISTAASPITNVVATSALLVLGHSRAALVGSDDAFALRWFYPSLDTFNVVTAVTHGSGIPPLYVVSMLVVFAGFVGLGLLLGSVLMERRDL